MPTIIVQAVTDAGVIVEGARWTSDTPWMQEGHSVSVTLPVEDPKLWAHLAGLKGKGFTLDPENKSVVLDYVVQRIRHIIGTTGPGSMATVSPSNRIAEQILTYLTDASKCDPKFVAAVRGR